MKKPLIYLIILCFLSFKADCRELVSYNKALILKKKKKRRLRRKLRVIELHDRDH
ncbi:hypothetical protein TTHERM_00628660 (macronuclear) [Tetrahymena thermophila SB210]|uniref:Transmembrane protein n=1 Tax=Tetrahymena thermophila (strain SB210) TaxID=312017 RepID=Q23RT2_TETTS|nr:hypothetical protein TTHERM_00628660 [Tetrahymena thermophila SB210]EAR99307.1 hypothetical protein TTHERM_00628660 [Tetrahymena thermophila SB210]|eukprot:XP_001019552.1 hypothetical protein TTHERM_00628660 [Tetrahymena thermophila SB210]